MAGKLFQIQGQISNTPRDRWIITLLTSKKQADQKIATLEGLLKEYKDSWAKREKATSYEEKNQLNRANAILFEKIKEEDPHWIVHGGQSRYEQFLDVISYQIATGEMRRDEDVRATRDR